MSVSINWGMKMNIDLRLMLKIFLIQCLLTMIFAIPFHLGSEDSVTSTTTQKSK